jgi:hypothetical protein
MDESLTPRQKYNRSANHKAAVKRYAQSPPGRAKERLRSQERNRSGKGAEYTKRYTQSPKGQAMKRLQYQRRAAENKRIIADAKSVPCVDCRGSFPPCCMDFHHIAGNKRFSVGKSVQRTSATLRKEIEKCIVICSNCHRIRHHGRGEK